MATVASLRGRLRAEHLRTHLRQTDLLSADQIRRDRTLRGYGKPEAVGPHAHSPGHH